MDSLEKIKPLPIRKNEKEFVIFVVDKTVKSSCMNRADIVQSIREALKKKFPCKLEAMLYGSEARGDARPDSDIDLLILVDKDAVSLEDELQITEPLYKIELESGILINPFILPKKIWGRIITPFYENVMKEGILL